MNNIYLITFLVKIDDVYILSDLFSGSGVRCAAKYGSANQVLFGLLLMVRFSRSGSVWSFVDGLALSFRFDSAFCWWFGSSIQVWFDLLLMVWFNNTFCFFPRLKVYQSSKSSQVQLLSFLSKKKVLPTIYIPITYNSG